MYSRGGLLEVHRPEVERLTECEARGEEERHREHEEAKPGVDL
jgi:hypothetical protein